MSGLSLRNVTGSLVACLVSFLWTGCSGGTGSENPQDSDGVSTTAVTDTETDDTDTDTDTHGTTASEDDAAILAVDLPESLGCGEDATGTVTVENTGTATWTREAGYKLGAVDDSDPFYAVDTRVWLPDDTSVAPGETWTFEIAMDAPLEEGSFTTDWQMVHEGIRWFGESTEREVAVACSTVGRRGRVRLNDHSLEDDDGTFNALGATVMWAAWAYRNDQDKLRRNLAFLASHGFHYVRVLGVVGSTDEEDYWDGREIDWRWSDYEEVIAGLTDLAYDEYGLRVEWTLIGDGQLNIPEESDRYGLVDTFVAMSQGREEKIIHFEIANEAWQNGFEGSSGNRQLRELTAYLRARTEILVAASAPPGHECEDIQEVYEGDIADLATIHFDRDTSKTEGSWRPVRQPWELEYCEDVPVGSNNEPIGPGSSVDTEEEPIRLVAGAITTYVSNLPLYVFHSTAGVRGDTELYDMSGVDAFARMAEFVPGDLASWDRRNAYWSDSPFVVYARDASGRQHADTMWVDLDDPVGGVVRAYAGVSGDRFFVHPIGIMGEVLIEARRAMSFEVIEPLSAAVLDTVTLAEGEQYTLSGAEALVLTGRFD